MGWVWPFIVMVLLVTPSAASAIMAHHQEKCKPPYTILWVYTFPAQKTCVLLTHPNAHIIAKENKANMKYNKGVEAGRAMSLVFNSTENLKCPRGQTKDFCAGWATTATS